MRKDVDARRGNWGVVKVIVSMQLGPCRQFGVEVGAREEV
jgi:hypothetical protein